MAAQQMCQERAELSSRDWSVCPQEHLKLHTPQKMALMENNLINSIQHKPVTPRTPSLQ